MRMLSFYIVLELLTFIAALVWCNGRKSGVFKLFIPFTLLTVFTESTARYLGYYCNVKDNSFVYTIFYPIDFLFYSYLFYVSVRNQALRKTVGVIAVLVLAFMINNAIWIQGFFKLNTYSDLLERIVLVGFCFLYLFDLLQQSEDIQSPLKLPMFWVVTGLLFYNLGGMVMISLYDFARVNKLNWNGTRIFDIVFRTINVLLYAPFIIAFRLCYKSGTPSYSSS